MGSENRANQIAGDLHSAQDGVWTTQSGLCNLNQEQLDEFAPTYSLVSLTSESKSHANRVFAHLEAATVGGSQYRMQPLPERSLGAQIGLASRASRTTAIESKTVATL
jgi:hypothetical protein